MQERTRVEKADDLWGEIYAMVESSVADIELYLGNGNDDGVVTVMRELTHDIVRLVLSEAVLR